MKANKHVFAVEVSFPEPVDRLRAEAFVTRRTAVGAQVAVVQQQPEPQACDACGRTGRHAWACRHSLLNQAQLVEARSPAERRQRR